MVAEAVSVSRQILFTVADVCCLANKDDLHISKV